MLHLLHLYLTVSSWNEWNQFISINLLNLVLLLNVELYIFQNWILKCQAFNHNGYRCIANCVTYKFYKWLFSIHDLLTFFTKCFVLLSSQWFCLEEEYQSERLNVVSVSDCWKYWIKTLLNILSTRPAMMDRKSSSRFPDVREAVTWQYHVTAWH
jgi:hypothetical protein